VLRPKDQKLLGNSVRTETYCFPYTRLVYCNLFSSALDIQRAFNSASMSQLGSSLYHAKEDPDSVMWQLSFASILRA